jgi:Double zinc ribbon
MATSDSPLHRFHQILCESLSVRGAEALTRPFTVAEIYQDLVPYRTHRDRLGIEMNGDYEHLLLRLLAGEEGLVKLEAEPALSEIRGELESSNPNTGLYRDYAALDVRLMEGNPPLSKSLEEEFEDVPEEVVEDIGGGGEAPASVECGWCSRALPDRPRVSFCPHCGVDLAIVPCPECREAMEPDWRYCIVCGTEVPEVR